MQTTCALVSHGGFTAAQAITKEIFDQVRKDLDCELFYSEQMPQRLTLYLLSSHR